MVIQWLNSDMTEALVTRGWWRWKRQAHVVYLEPHEVVGYPRLRGWYHVATQRACDHRLVQLIGKHSGREARKQHRALVAERERGNWQPVRSLPKARVVK